MSSRFNPLPDRFVDPIFGTFSLGLAQRHYALGALWCGRPVQLVLEIPNADDDRDLTQPLAHARAFFTRPDDWQAYFAQSLPPGQEEPVSLEFAADGRVTARFRNDAWDIITLSALLPGKLTD